jgi:hypothetical protein
MKPEYQVRKSPFKRGLWEVTRLDQPCHIGKVKSRKEAIYIARVLAGWRGTVTIKKG